MISRTSNAVPLPVYDRKTGTRFQEFLSGSPATYEARPHRSVTNIVQSHPAYDWLVSMYQNTRLSARKIEPFIRKHHIDMDEFEPGPYELTRLSLVASSSPEFDISRSIPTSWELSPKRDISPGKD